MASNSSEGEGFVWIIIFGLAIWFAYDKWWKEDEPPVSPAPIPLYSPDPRPTGLRKLGSDSEGTVRWLDNDSVAGPREKRRGWITSLHDKDKTVAQRETKEMLLANCDEGAYTIPAWVTYDKNQKVMSTWSATEGEKLQINRPAPGTIGATNFNAICDKRFDPIMIAPPPVTK